MYSIANPHYRYVSTSPIFTHNKPSVYYRIDMNKSRMRELVRGSDKFDRTHIKKFINDERYDELRGVVEGWCDCTSCDNKCDYCVANMSPLALRQLFYDHSNVSTLKLIRERARRRLFDSIKLVDPIFSQKISLVETDNCPIIKLIDSDLKEAVLRNPSVLPIEARTSYLGFCERMTELYKPLRAPIERQGNNMSIPMQHVVDSTNMRDDLQSFSTEFFRQAKELVESTAVPPFKLDATIGLSDFVYEMAKKMGASCFLIYAVCQKDMALIGVATMLCGLVFMQEQVDQISTKVKDAFGIQKQGFGPTLSSLLGCFVLSDAVKRATGSHTNFLTSFANDSVFFERRTKGLADMIDFLLDLVQRGLDALWKSMSGVPCPIRIIDPDLQDAYALVKRILDVESSRNAGELTTSEAFFQLQSLNEEVCKLIEHKGGRGSASRVLQPYQSILASALREVQSLLKANGGFRQQPVGLVLIGAPGIGKSFLSTTFAAIFAEKFASPHTREEMVNDSRTVGRNIYQWDASSQYYSGYTGQTVFFIDEASTKALVPNAIPFPVAVINMINTIPMSLNMAELTNKGNTFFCSKAILATTNKRNWGDLGDISNEAVYRRLNFVSVVVASKEFACNPESSQEEWMLNPEGKQHYRDVTARFVDGIIDTTTYFDEVYKILEFKLIDMSSCQGQVHHRSRGNILTPSQLLSHIMQEEAVNRMAVDTTANIIHRIVDERRQMHEQMPGGFEKQGGFMDGPMTVRFNDAMIRFYARIVLASYANRWFFPFSQFQQFEPVDFKTSTGAHFSAFPSEGKFERIVGDKSAQTGEHLDYLNKEVKMCNLMSAIVPNLADRLMFHNKFASNLAIRGLQYVGTLESYDASRPTFDPTTINFDTEYFCPCCYQFRGHPTELELQSIYAMHVSYQKRRILDGAIKEFAKQSCTLTGSINLISMAAKGFAVFKVASWLFSKVYNPQKQGDYVFTNKNKQKTKLRTHAANERRAEKQNALSNQLCEKARSVRGYNQYHFTLIKHGKPFYQGNLLMVQQGIGMLPRHLVEAWVQTLIDDPLSTIEFSSIKKDDKKLDHNIRVVVPIKNLFIWDDNLKEYEIIGGAWDVGETFSPTPKITCSPDLVVIKVPLSGRSILNNFISKDEYVTGAKMNTGVLSILERDALGVQKSGSFEYLADAMHINTSTQVVYEDELGEPVYEDDCDWFSNYMVEYQIQTEKGNCGSPFFSIVGGQPRIISVHVAGQTNVWRGFGVIAIREHVKDAINQLVNANLGTKGQVNLDTMEIQGLMMEAGFEPLDGEYEGHAIIGRVKGHVLPKGTTLIKSPLNAPFQQFVKHRMEPAALVPFVNHDGVLIDPMRVAQTGYGHGGIYPDSGLTSFAVESVWKSIITACHPHDYERTKPDWKTVVAPGAGWSHTRSIQRGTSPGYPYCLKYKKGKKDFFGTGDDFDFGTPEAAMIFKEAEELEEAYARGERPLVTCMSFLKDERRPIDRVRSGKTRLISASGLAFTLVCRKYTMGFVNFLTRGRITNGVAVGVNPFSDEWTALAMRHGSDMRGVLKGLAVAGDYSSYDKDITPQDISDFGDILDVYYDDDERSRTIRRSILNEIANSRHMVNGLIIEWLGSNTSGNPITTPLNSVINQVKIRSAIAKKHAEANRLELSRELFSQLFHGPRRLFEVTTYGDDNMATSLYPHLSSVSWFSQSAIAEALLELFGMKYTDESKGKRDFTELRPLTEISFLKRGFSFGSLVPDRSLSWIAPLDIETLYTSLMWTKKRDHDLSFWHDNIKNMIEESSLHDAETHELFMKRLKDSLSSLDKHQVISDFETRADYQARALSRDLTW